MLRLYHTLKYLKPIQIYYRFFYAIRNNIGKNIFFYAKSPKSKDLRFIKGIFAYPSCQKNEFTFLNITHKFEDSINWNYSENGKLWTYNLNYFDYLNQPEMKKNEGLWLIKNYVQHIKTSKDGLEPYPISLKGINWIKFLSFHNIKDREIDDSLYSQYKHLCRNIEYHLLANHLLENGFSLLFGGMYFRDKRLYKKGRKIVVKQLKEQILNDGGHFERSPMYHQIILYRLLDSINLFQQNQVFEKQADLCSFMEEKAKRMIQWLKTISFSGGSIPLFNDSTTEIAPTTQKLLNYAERMGLQTASHIHALSDSGYRIHKTPIYECVVNVGEITPAYQPGHAHADTFSFVLYAHQKPIIIDTGISTYENNKQRLIERGTSAHNTVTIDGKNSSDIWSSFRVGKRAKVKLLYDTPAEISAVHNGYLEAKHQRIFKFDKNKIIITDILTNKAQEGVAYFQLSPNIDVNMNQNTIRLSNVTCTLKGASKIELEEIQLPIGYNSFAKTKRIKVSFIDLIITTFVMQ